MMMVRRAIRMGVIAAIIVAGMNLDSAWSEPSPALDVPAMAHEADLIVVGRVRDIRIQGRSSSALLVVSVDVEHALKGIGGSRPLTVRIASPDSMQGNIVASQYGIFFLKRAAGDIYTPADSNYPMLPAVGAADMPVASGPLQSVAHELVRVMTTPGPSRLQAESAEALQTIPYEDARSALRSALAGRYVPGRLWALSALFFMEEDGQLDAARVRYLGSLEEVLLDPTPDALRAASSVAIAMQIRSLPPQAVPVLAGLLQSREPAIRRAAASALGDIESWRAVRPLATLALDDDDAEVRSYATAGLAQITGEGPAGKATGDNALRYWRTWARANLR
jgi:hypothetical protein